MNSPSRRRRVGSFFALAAAVMGFSENAASHFGPLAGATWLKKNGNSAIGGDAAWTELMKWQKGFIDAIGYDRVDAFRSGLGQVESITLAGVTG